MHPHPSSSHKWYPLPVQLPQEECGWRQLLVPGIEGLKTILLLSLLEGLADSGQDSLPTEVG